MKMAQSLRSGQRNLRSRRLAVGLTIDELSRRAGVERSRLSRGERDYVFLGDEEVARLEAEIRKAAR